MKIFKLLLDGFKGKPDLSEMSIDLFRVDDYLIKFEFPKDILEKCHYEDCFLFEDFNIKSTEYIHQKYVNLFYVGYSFRKIVTNYIFPVNTLGKLYINLRIKKSNATIETENELSNFIEREYNDYYHDPNPCSDSMRGYHTDLMNDARIIADQRWGVNPDDEDKIKKKEKYLIHSFFLGYPPIKCKEVNIGNHRYVKYEEGNVYYKYDLKRVYNIIISGGFYLSVEFWYKLDSSYTNKKLLNWVSNADAKFEKEMLERLELSNYIDSCLNSAEEKLRENSAKQKAMVVGKYAKIGKH